MTPETPPRRDEVLRATLARRPNDRDVLSALTS